MTKVLVLGGGLVGSVIALDLVADPDLEVCIADIDASKLEVVRTAGGGRLETITADCSDVDHVRA